MARRRFSDRAYFRYRIGSWGGTLPNGVKYLLRQLFFTKLVQSVKFSCKRNVFEETARGQFHSDDDLTVRNHHGDSPELDLEILGELFTTSVAWILETKALCQIILCSTKLLILSFVKITIINGANS